MKFRDRRKIEAEIHSAKIATFKMERALDHQYEHLRKLEQELADAHNQPVSPVGS
jgi:hypothetical protein